MCRTYVLIYKPYQIDEYGFNGKPLIVFKRCGLLEKLDRNFPQTGEGKVGATENFQIAPLPLLIPILKALEIKNQPGSKKNFRRAPSEMEGPNFLRFCNV